MGVVYKARQISLNRSVALKMIRAGTLAGAGEDERRRFQNEAEAVARLDHPHIVPIHEVGEHDGKRYFSMKLIDGPCLSRSLLYKANPRNAAMLMVTIAEAVHHAHQRGILHRDLKPSNILLDERGEPHVSDFGLAKQVEGDGTLTSRRGPRHSGLHGSRAGRREQEARDNSERRLRTGCGPVRSTHRQAAIRWGVGHGDARPGAPTSSPFLPPGSIRTLRDLEIICLKCLDKEPQRRYTSAEELAAELRRFLGGEPIQARPTSALEKGWRWCRRRPVIAGMSAALVMAVLGGLIGTSIGMVAAIRARQKEREQTHLAEQSLRVPHGPGQGKGTDRAGRTTSVRRPT